MAVSAAVVVVVGLALGIDWLASRQTKVSQYVPASVVSRVDLRLASGSVAIVGSTSSTVEVRRTDNYAFDHAAREERSIAGGVLKISSRCPRIVLGDCSASYEIAVPETVAVDVQTTAGDIRVTGYRGNATVASRSGNVDVEAYCGFDLTAASGSGSVHVAAACSPQHLSVRSNSGDASALVPPGRYRVNATGAPGKEKVAGIVVDDRAPFTIDAHSGTGAVAVEGGL